MRIRIITSPPSYDDAVRVLMICKGNICRSPLAAAVLARLADARGIAVEIRSAATEERTVGRAAHELARSVASRHGYDLESHVARRAAVDDIEWADVIVVMDAENAARVAELFGDTAKRKTLRLGSFDAAQADIRDPYSQSEAVFEETLAAIERACAIFLDSAAAPGRETTPVVTPLRERGS